MLQRTTGMKSRWDTLVLMLRHLSQTSFTSFYTRTGILILDLFTSIQIKTLHVFGDRFAVGNVSAEKLK